jgi:peptide/nickel transport system permease protein
VARRLAAQFFALAVALVAASAFVYVLTVQLPGDPALAVFRAQFGTEMNPEPAILERIREEAGFDDPLPVQYGRWLGRALTGDFGRSYITRQDAWGLVSDRLGVTLVLAFGGVLLGFAAAVGAALTAVQWRRVHGPMTNLAQTFQTTPDYLLAALGILLFAVALGWVPVTGWGSPQQAIVPLLVVASGPWAAFTRLMITGLDEGMRSDWARTARAKGLRESTIIRRHALPHALGPSINVAGLAVGAAISSTLVVEVIFAIPGAGRLLFDAIAARDLPVVQAALTVQVVIAVTANRIADILVVQLDPVLRTSERAR